MCQYCKEEYGKNFNIMKSPTRLEPQPNQAIILQVKGDTPGIVLCYYGEAQGYFDIIYCPFCGRKLI
ncbi:hypothetical protein FDG46_17305 [Clostridium botulinum]|uniref:hypothetical protein n=1 Tax=Clostridium botulinum TaxID=1491 RepID=UPI0001591F5F|nr:hypothetical protein [Clostridium botulinum]ABS34768.1 hypothetical protein CLB_2464 [Clostridium botulinum A str. ATCC 19397]MBO3438466.1 hypothetical protein [Clostridium botulinum]NFH87855.1 hypothetical protein [Clostridium botulinum]NFJ77474.1 hypothetical protein [Clostridium botulinum]NFM55084.1 hypothetical protein [Clostridium botulinum]